MTTWAGYFLRRPNDVAPPALVRELRGALSRTTGSPVSTLDLGRLVVAQIDVDAYGAPSRRQDERGLAVFAGDLAQARALNARLLKLHQDLFIQANPIPVKWAVAQMGLIGPALRLPLTPLSDQYGQIVRNAVSHAGIAI